MHIRTIDLDGSIASQTELLSQCAGVIPMQSWAQRIRMACSFRRFRAFERDLGALLGMETDGEPAVTFYGSGDFHHVSLALVRRLTTPFNLLVIDNHPDWMRGVPFLHCGTWLYHAARLPLVQRIFHVGGDVDFDNSYHWLAPRRDLHSGKITVFPGIRRFEGRFWSAVANEPLRPANTDLTAQRMGELLRPHGVDLALWPLYISLDKDVMTSADAVVNWDSGHLRLRDVQTIVNTFLNASMNRLAGMDIVGDWSPASLRGWFRRVFHLTMHPPMQLDPVEATNRNEQGNLALLETLRQHHFLPLAA